MDDILLILCFVDGSALSDYCSLQMFVARFDAYYIFIVLYLGT